MQRILSEGVNSIQDNILKNNHIHHSKSRLHFFSITIESSFAWKNFNSCYVIQFVFLHKMNELYNEFIRTKYQLLKIACRICLFLI